MELLVIGKYGDGLSIDDVYTYYDTQDILVTDIQYINRSGCWKYEGSGGEKNTKFNAIVKSFPIDQTLI